MSKIGVGVGEDFPVDDGAGKTGPGDDDRAEYEDWRRRRDEWRSKREQYRAEQDEWRARRDEWRDRKRAFKEKVRSAARETFGPEWDAYRDARRRYGHYYWPFSYGMMRILGIVLVIALISEVFKAPLLFLGLGAVAWFFFHHHHGYGRRDYDFDARPASGPSPSAKPAEPPPAQEAS